MADKQIGETGSLVVGVAASLRAQYLGALSFVPFVSEIAHLSLVGVGAAMLMRGPLAMRAIGLGVATAGLNKFVTQVPDLLLLGLGVGFVLYAAKSLKNFPFVGKWFAKIPGI